MTNKIRSILAAVFRWIGSLIIVLAYKDNTKKTLQICAQAFFFFFCVAVSVVVDIILGMIPFVGALLAGALNIALFVFYVLNIIKACQYDTAPSMNLPLFDKMANAIFGSMIAKGLDMEPVTAEGGPVDPNMNQQSNANPNPDPNMNPNMNAQGPVNPVQPQQPQQPMNNNDINNPNNMNQ